MVFLRSAGVRLADRPDSTPQRTSAGPPRAWFASGAINNAGTAVQ
jgi:hypothetical protein